MTKSPKLIWDKVSRETRRKISNASKTMWKSDEYRNKQTKAHLGHKASEETKLKMSKSHIAHIDDKYRKKLSLAQRKSAKKNERVNYRWLLDLGLVPDKAYTWDKLSKLIVNDNKEPYYRTIGNFIRCNKTLFDVVEYKTYKFLNRKDLL